jgi:hypothetical protein
VGHAEAKWFQEQGNKTSKRMKKSEWWCMIDNFIDDCDFERLMDDFTALRTECQEHHGRVYEN